jgi:hypothetical protein
MLFEWELESDDSPSFAKRFKDQVTLLSSRSESLSMKSLSITEKHDNGPSLKRFGKLDVEQLTLNQNHDHTWASHMLSSYAPSAPHNLNWALPSFDWRGPRDIKDESAVVAYFQIKFLDRVHAAGVFLFLKSHDKPPELCPSLDGCNVEVQSSSGPNGRPDIQMVRNGNFFCLVEAKTKKVCKTERGDAMEVVSRASEYGDQLLLGDSEVVHGSPEEKKGMTIIYQVRRVQSPRGSFT